jgi:hypothetical protein
MQNLLAQNEHPLGNPLKGIGTYGLQGTNATQSPTLFSRILTNIIGLLTLVAGIWFLFLLLAGGIAWLSSGGDKGKLAQARTQIFTGIIGLAIVVAALFITEIIGGILGFGDILNPVSFINSISP